MPSIRMSEFTTELTKHDDPQKWSRDTSRSLISHAELDALDMSRAELFACYVIASRLKTVTDRAVEISSIGKKLSGPLANGVTTDICSVADDVACSVDNAAIAVLSGDMTNVQQARNRCDSATETISAVESRLYDGNVTESTSTSAALANTPPASGKWLVAVTEWPMLRRWPYFVTKISRSECADVGDIRERWGGPFTP